MPLKCPQRVIIKIVARRGKVQHDLSSPILGVTCFSVTCTQCKAKNLKFEALRLKYENLYLQH